MLTCILVATWATAVAGEPSWEHAGDTDGVVVWTRNAPQSSLLEVKAETLAMAGPRRVLEVIDDLAHYPEFVPYVKEARLVERFAGGHHEYQLIDPPFVDQRDYTIAVQLDVDAATGVIERRWREANDKGPPPREGVVRVPVNRGGWTLTPLAGGAQTRITYHVHTDPGGAVPAWLANRANTTSVPALLAAVRRRAADPTWRPR